MDVTVSKVLCLISVIVFVLVGFGVTIGSTSPLELLSFGLAFFASAHLVP